MSSDERRDLQRVWEARLRVACGCGEGAQRDSSAPAGFVVGVARGVPLQLVRPVAFGEAAAVVIGLVACYKLVVRELERRPVSFLACLVAWTRTFVGITRPEEEARER